MIEIGDLANGAFVKRAEFEQALLEAQEAERAEKEARRLAARQAAAQKEEASSTAEESLLPEEMQIDETAEISEESMPAQTDEQEEQKETDEDQPQVICASFSDETEEDASPIFFVDENDEDTADMPAIKVGSEPSSFIFLEPPEPEPVEEDEETALAALLARMSPEQLAKFREEMFAEEENDTAAEPIGDELPEELPEEITETQSEETADEQTAEVIAPIHETVVADVSEEAWEIPENADGMADAFAESIPSVDEDPVDAILNDPDKLDELMSRLAPEQAAELRQMLEEEIPVDEEAEEPTVYSREEENEPEPVWNDGFAADIPTEEPEMTVLWSETAEHSDGVILEDMTEEIPPKEGPEEETETAEEDLYSMEISEDMTDEEISLMLGLGYEKELV